MAAIALSCADQAEHLPKPLQKTSEASRDSIINEHLVNGAWKMPLYSQERLREIDKALAKDSTIAYLWQQRSMPLLKQGKYEIAMPYVDQAVKYDPDRWQDYRAYVKCIFAKTYRSAIKDFLECKARYGNQIVMDHTYNFYIGLSYLQLDEFEKAQTYFQADYDSIMAADRANWLHHLDLFYYGISAFELGNNEEALNIFDQALELYPTFSDVQFYQARCYAKLGEKDSAEVLFFRAKENASLGYTINEDGAVYERYPYQVRWPLPLQAIMAYYKSKEEPV